MATSNNGHQDNHHTGQGLNSLPGHSGAGNPVPMVNQIDRSVASEVMDLAYDVTLASADIYELVAILAECLAESLQSNLPPMHPPIQYHSAPLLNILSAVQKSEVRIRLLESKITGERPENLKAFIQDCWTALGVFNEVGRRLSGVIGINEWAIPQMTISETLIQVMEHMDTCSLIVSGLPATGMAVSTQCLAETAFSLQRHSSDLIEGSTRSH